MSVETYMYAFPHHLSSFVVVVRIFGLRLVLAVLGFLVVLFLPETVYVIYFGATDGCIVVWVYGFGG